MCEPLSTRAAQPPARLVHSEMAVMAMAASGRLLILSAILGCTLLRTAVRPYSIGRSFIELPLVF
jgi:hypothetical protein